MFPHWRNETLNSKQSFRVIIMFVRVCVFLKALTEEADSHRLLIQFDLRRYEEEAV